jgi:hypothetical protein
MPPEIPNGVPPGAPDALTFNKYPGHRKPKRRSFTAGQIRIFL